MIEPFIHSFITLRINLINNIPALFLIHFSLVEIKRNIVCCIGLVMQLYVNCIQAAYVSAKVLGLLSIIAFGEIETRSSNCK